MKIDLDKVVGIDEVSYGEGNIYIQLVDTEDVYFLSKGAGLEFVAKYKDTSKPDLVIVGAGLGSTYQLNVEDKAYSISTLSNVYNQFVEDLDAENFDSFKVSINIDNDALEFFFFNKATKSASFTSVDLGFKSDNAASSDTGSFSLISLVKRLLVKFTDGIGVSGMIGAAISSTFNRPNNTTAYTANAVINNSTSSPINQSLSNVARVNGSSGYIRFILNISNVTVTNKIRVHVYDSAPTTPKNDGATWALDFANDANKYLGYVDLEPLNRGVASSGSFLMYKAASGSRTLFYELQTLEAVVPTASTSYMLKAIPDQNNV